MAFADPVLVEIERKVDAGEPLSMDDGLASKKSARAAKAYTTFSTAISIQPTFVLRAARFVRSPRMSSKNPNASFG
jgi:hypothetical protein